MSNPARWEQESRQPLGPLQPDIPQPTQTWEVVSAEPTEAAETVAPESIPAPTDGREQKTTEADMDALLAADDDESFADAFDQESDDDDDAAAAARTAAAREKLVEARRSLATTGRTFGRWVSSLDRRPEFTAHHSHDPLAQVSAATPAPSRPAAPAPEASASPQPAESVEASQFPTAPLGYNRQAVDEYLGMLESELAQLRARGEQVAAPISITEEIERIGEETASILVVAHDKAHETARRAQDQAQRRVREADARAHAITAEAQRRLSQLDEETDLVWRERERLLEDARTVCASLTALVDSAAQRFPADPEPMAPAHAAQIEAEELESTAETTV